MLHSGKEKIDVEIRREDIKLKTYLLPGSSLGDSIDSSWRRNLWLMTLSGRLDILRTFSPRRPFNLSDQVQASLIITLKVAF